MRAFAVVIVALALTGCQRAAEKAGRDYEFLEQSGTASREELCRAATKARDAWAARHNEDRHRYWQVVAYDSCHD